MTVEYPKLRRIPGARHRWLPGTCDERIGDIAIDGSREERPELIEQHTGVSEAGVIEHTEASSNQRFAAGGSGELIGRADTRREIPVPARVDWCVRRCQAQW